MTLLDLTAWPVLYFAMSCGCCSEDTMQDTADLQGEWHWVAIEVEGKANMPEEILGQKWVIAGNIIMAVVPGIKDHAMAFKLDASKMPKEMDLLPLYDEKAARVNYRIDGEWLRVATECAGETMVFRKVVQ
jgi:uncharacterized protein (TIGR03067 family)